MKMGVEWSDSNMTWVGRLIVNYYKNGWGARKKNTKPLARSNNYIYTPHHSYAARSPSLSVKRISNRNAWTRLCPVVILGFFFFLANLIRKIRTKEVKYNITTTYLWFFLKKKLQEHRVKYVIFSTKRTFFLFGLTSVHNPYSVSLRETCWETPTRSVLRRTRTFF